MIELYPQIKHAHIGLVMVSVALFALRGAAVQAGMRWPRARPVRLASYAIDTGLLAAGLWLVAILPGGFFANGWLTAKLVLLVVYVVLGVFAMRRARSRIGRALCYVAALATFSMIYGIARAHHPLGPLQGLLG
ncbi:MAG: SirB2 family protein [Gammaproteobacteria bacterium]|nr:SirB2 family protein [Gammaproteobacteria bacterium]